MAGSSKDFFDEIVQRQEAGQPVRCPVAKFLRGESGTEDRVLKGVERALGAPQIHSTTIAAVISENGIQCGEKAVQAHRRGACSCRKVSS